MLRSTHSKKLIHFPSSIGNLSSLGALALNDCGIQENLPDSVNNMMHLNCLSCDVRFCLPIVSNMSSLKSLLSVKGENSCSTKLFSLSKHSNLQDLK